MHLALPDKENFPRRLGLYYFLALGAIAITIVASQLLIQKHISSQDLDSHVINTAGRQRMLSQKVSKLVLQISELRANEINTQTLYGDLAKTLETWKEAHSYLSGEETQNSITNQQNYSQITPLFGSMLTSGNEIITNEDDGLEFIKPHVDNILINEGSYLTLMDKIVLQYEKEARSRLESLKKTEYIILGITLLLILIELVFVFRPLISKTNKTIEKLTQSERNATNMASQINKLYTELGKSYQDLEAVNIEPEKHSLFFKMAVNGDIIGFSTPFKKVFEFHPDHAPKNLKDWLKKESYDKSFIKGLFDLVEDGRSWNGELRLTNDAGDFIFLDVFITASKRLEKRELLVIARNVTELKEAQHRSREINLEKIEKSVKEQQYRSVLILEGQEEERKRIAREMHDGIGQMLTALKINMEAITPSSSVHTKKKIEDARHLLKRVLQEIRRVSFNLTPASLIDFGIVPAIRKFCSEMSTLSEIQVSFANSSNFINRLDKNIETNLYRIVQEAVNNSIKYSKAEEIFVSFEHSYEDISIEVRDNGVGFEYDQMKQNGHFGKSGHGIFNMKERAGFIGAKLDVVTAPGKGTKIKLSLPIID